MCKIYFHIICIVVISSRLVAEAGDKVVHGFNHVGGSESIFKHVGGSESMSGGTVEQTKTSEFGEVWGKKRIY